MLSGLQWGLFGVSSLNKRGAQMYVLEPKLKQLIFIKL